jgi:hypothetical protein
MTPFGVRKRKMITKDQSKALVEVIRQRDLLEKALNDVENLRKLVTEALRVLSLESGKGPYDLGDGRSAGWTIAKRGELYFMIPTKAKGSKGGRKKKVVSEPVEETSD